MSEENVLAFFKKLENDDDLKAEVARLLESEGEDTQEKVLQLARESGFEFTDEEFASVESTLTVEKEIPYTGELSDEDLEYVAGGVTVDPNLHRDLYRNLPRVTL